MPAAELDVAPTLQDLLFGLERQLGVTPDEALQIAWDQPQRSAEELPI